MSPSSQSTNNIVHIPYDMKIDVNKTLSEYVFEALQKHSKKIAQINSETGKTETYGQILNRIISLAQAFKTKGITSDDIVGLCCYNNMDYLAVMIASIFIGARFSSIDVTGAKSEYTHCLKLTSPVVIFCEQETEEMLESAINEAGIKCEMIIFDKSDKHITMENFVLKYKSNEEFEINTSRTMKDTTAIVFTSGTSGLSKGAQVCSFGLYHGALVVTRSISEAKRFMIFTLPYWISNIVFSMVAVLHGFERVILKTFDVQRAIKLISEFKVHHTIFTQHVMNDLINNPGVTQYDTTSFKYVHFGGSKIGPKLISEMSKLFPHTTFLNAFGMTEFGGIVCLPNQEIDAEANFTAGGPNPGVYYKIVDTSTGENLGPHKRGELRVKSDGIMNGYLHQPDVTAEAFDEYGYLKTGDIVYYDEKYNFFITDRLKQIFKYQGHHISPVVIEDTVSLHPDVNDCAVIPLPHEHDGDIPLAIIKLNENVNVTEQDIIQYVEEHLSDWYHLRGGVKFVNCIPRTSTGKVLRNRLIDMYVNKK